MTESCPSCQDIKISGHIAFLISIFKLPSARFKHTRIAIASVSTSIQNGTLHVQEKLQYIVQNVDSPVGCFYQQLKASISISSNDSWTEVLPLVQFGVKNAFKDGIQPLLSRAVVIFGQLLKFPRELFEGTPADASDVMDFIVQLRNFVENNNTARAMRYGKDQICLQRFENN
ncbi:hypothetical protein EVAR_68047_1 [Eumeta japonica]|uniref:Uncharacterized protein n=1 Tax=Eumeta variegata TaxID=151549 RepID=A0A4C1ZS19_EUMVA|nr:hypothetical protein EVAR_68047_1 [Eumeta japonica]